MKRTTRRLSALLDEYRRLREERMQGESKRKQAVAALLVSGLQQRLLSSLEAFARTLRVRREAEGDTLRLLEEALHKPVQSPNTVILKLLQETGPRDVAELLPHLEKRGEALAAGAIRLLIKRGEDEAKAMRGILEDQRKRILATVEQHRETQPGPFHQEEMRQLEADQRHWGRRLADIEQELTTEPDRIRGVYAVKARRIEPVGLVYLWPLSG